MRGQQDLLDRAPPHSSLHKWHPNRGTPSLPLRGALPNMTKNERAVNFAILFRSPHLSLERRPAATVKCEARPEGALYTARAKDEEERKAGRREGGREGGREAASAACGVWQALK